MHKQNYTLIGKGSVQKTGTICGQIFALAALVVW